jgi:hypothetical protein
MASRAVGDVGLRAPARTSMTFLSSNPGRRSIHVMSVKDRDQPLKALDQRLEELRELTRSLEQARDALVRLRHDDAHTAVRDAAERYNISDEALIAFLENAGELLNGKDLSVADARRAGMLAAAGTAWENELGPLLTSAQVRELLGQVSRQRVDELLRSRRLIGMSDRSGRRRFPLFQFRDGRPTETLVAAYWTVVEGGADEWTAASWCVAPDPALAGSSPVQWSKTDSDAELLLRVARQDAARFAR